MTVGRPRHSLREASSIRTRNAEAQHCRVLLFKDANGGHEAAGESALATMAEEEIGVAGGAEITDIDIFCV